MKYVDDFRGAEACLAMARQINAAAADRSYRIMEVCGTHTAAIRRFGIPAMLSSRIRLISGPGCPVCVTSDAYLRNAFRMAADKNVTIATYPDMLRVPADGMSLQDLKAKGADVRAVNSALEVLEIARESEGRTVVFLAVGFETTAPATAILAQRARRERIKNLKIYSAHKTIPPALLSLGRDKELCLDGFLLPGHVSVVIGVQGYRRAMRSLRLPAVVTGFEPLDILSAILTIVDAARHRKAVLRNGYGRVVREGGNPKAVSLLKEVFVSKDSLWRGLGVIPGSGLFLRKPYDSLDARRTFSLRQEDECRLDNGCRCAGVLTGKIEPSACRYFGKQCIPQKPLGPCMVSREGTCRAFFETR
ncbi:[NiFe] hydrogenase metallocenter assembly protein HypD [Candidatus Velamenicoccus archaeovorus]|uniref:[NiFe] hydrogenase metallocenter assembly protein HypD n=1 Tax=Velamenicoccus archaeovorus TaxID=1930593 RepID=A0A410P626_VELA1|nr:hydrogenase formation protein HypD [Candidatus Velamenicoccus archaeovorus]QAT17629.1 [NiFe] hydrogenase metallocenter assembly protein HypD [Candidatus Velamenicoccus archaeovorus]